MLAEEELEEELDDGDTGGEKPGDSGSGETDGERVEGLVGVDGALGELGTGTLAGATRGASLLRVTADKGMVMFLAGSLTTVTGGFLVFFYQTRTWRTGTSTRRWLWQTNRHW